MSWQTVTFEEAPFEIIDGDRGKNYPNQSQLHEEGYCLFLSATNVTKDGFVFDSCQFVTQEKHEVLRKGTVDRGDVVLTTRGTLGNVGFYSENIPFPHVRINSGMVTIKSDLHELLPAYVYYYLKSDLFQSQVRALQSGAAQPQLPIRDIKKIKFNYPDLPTQERIAAILSAYDDLIENNRRRIALLEQAARLLYREWFVHFRFPGHETAKFVDGLPEGWEEKKVGDLGAVVTGKTPSKKVGANFDGHIPFIKTPDMHGKIFVLSTGETLTEQGAKSQEKKTLPPRSILVSCIGTVGVVTMNANYAQFNQQINAVVPDAGNSNYYVYFALESIKPRLEAIGGGVTMANVSKSKFESVPVLVPNQSAQQDFHMLVEPIFDQIMQLAKVNAQLTRARDLLLPRLMDGRIPV